MADVPRFRGGGLSLGYGQGLARTGGAYVPLPDSRVLGNQHVFQQFRDAFNTPARDGSIPEVWREAFDDARHRVQRALAQQEAQREPYEAFVRLYTLRNKVMHSQPYQYAHAGAVAAKLDPRKTISMYCWLGARLH